MSFKLPSYNDLNATQKTIINILELDNYNDRLAVIGGPGTGKTIIGIQAASLMAESGKKCLFLTYSKPLSEFIKNIIHEKIGDDDLIEVNSYHKWLWHYLSKNQGLSDKDIKTNLQTASYTYDIKKLKDFLISHRIKPEDKYEYIFIDEAQDVQNGLFSILNMFTEKILVTFDDCQKIGKEEQDSRKTYDHSNILNELQIGDRFFDLIENYRNTKQIEIAAKTLLTSFDVNENSLQKSTSIREGKIPEIIYDKADDEDEYDSLCNYIVDNYDRSKSVAILIGNDNRIEGRNTFEKLKECFDNIKQQEDFPFLYKYGEFTNISERNILDNAIFLTTLRNSKGLEFDEVYVLASNINIDTYQGKNSLYVAFTRSKDMSTIILNKKTNKYPKLRDFIENQSHLFEKYDLE